MSNDAIQKAAQGLESLIRDALTQMKKGRGVGE